MTGQNLKANPPLFQIMNRIDQVPEIPSKPIQFPDNQRIAFSQCFQCGIQPRPGVKFA